MAVVLKALYLRSQISATYLANFGFSHPRAPKCFINLSRTEGKRAEQCLRGAAQSALMSMFGNILQSGVAVYTSEISPSCGKKTPCRMCGL